MRKLKILAIVLAVIAALGALVVHFLYSSLPRAFYRDERVVVNTPQVFPESGRIEVPIEPPIYRVNNIVSVQLDVVLKKSGEIEFADSETGIRSSKGERIQIKVSGISEDGRQFHCVPSGWNPDQIFMDIVGLPVGVRIVKLNILSADLKRLNRVVWHEVPSK